MKVKVIFILVSFVLLSVGTAYAQNNPPVLAPPGNQTVDENFFWSFPVSASDVDDDPLFLSTGNLPDSAYFIDLGNGIGNLYWQTTFDDAGPYDVTFYATDGQATDTVVITVTVTNINRVPIWDPIGDQAVLQGNPLTFAVSASDPDTNDLELSMTSPDLPVEAVFTDNGDGTGSFVWNSQVGDAGDYITTFTVNDGEDVVNEEITITILGRPQLETIGDQDVDEGELLTFVVTAIDPDGDIPALFMVDDDSLTTLTLPVEATFTDHADGTGTFTWTPGFDDAGIYGARFLAIDNVASPPDTVSETIQIMVDTVNRVPVLAAIGDQTLSEGETLTLGLFATDAEGDSIILHSSQLPQEAVLIDSGNGNGSFTWSPSLTYSRASYTQVISFYASDDPAGGTDTELVVFTVNVVFNESPVLDAIGDQAMTAGSLFELTVTATDPNEEFPMLSAMGLPDSATFTDNDDGTGLFSWTPFEPDQVGFHSVTFYASDGVTPVDSEVVLMQVVTSGNQPPVLDEIDDTLYILEGNIFELELTATDPNPTDILTFGIANPPDGAQVITNGDSTGTFTWTPGFDQAGTYYVIFYVTDGVAADSQQVTIKVVEAGNKSPLVGPIDDHIIKEDSLLEFEITAHDPEGEPVMFFPEDSGTVVLPEGATLTDYGNDTAFFSWTPSFCQNGSHLVTIVVSDGEKIGFRSTLVIVNEAGDQLPFLNPIGNLSVIEGDTLEVIVSSEIFLGCEVASVGTSLLPPNATFSDFGNGSGRFRWIPGYTQGGDPDSIYYVTFYADDGIFPADSEIVEITITDAGNQLPVFTSLTYNGIAVNIADANPDTLLVKTKDPLWVHAMADDPDSTDLTVSLLSLPNPAAIYIDSGNGAGLLTWTPNVDDIGYYNLTFTADDGSGSASVLVVLYVEPLSGKLLLAGVDGLYAPDTIVTCSEITFYIKAINNTGIDVSFFSNGFEIYSPDGATWTESSFDVTMSANPITVDTSVYRGSGVDTLRFSGFGIFDPVWPNGFEDTVWAITIGPIGSEHAGKTICLDSIQTKVNWKWTDSADNSIYPVWDHANCFTIFDPNQNQATSFTSAPNDTSVTECETLDLSMAATDPDGVFPFFEVEPMPDGATLTGNGDGTADFSWTPTGVQEGVYDLTFIATDGCAGDTQMVTITVNSEPPPVMNAVGNQTIKVCDTLVIDLSVSDPGGPGNPTWTNSDFVDETVNVVDNGDGTGTFTFTPTSDQVDTHSITFYVTDSDCGSVDSEVVAIEVIPDDLPTLTFDAPSYTVSECEELVITVDGDDPQGTDVTLEVSEFGDEAAVFDTVGNSGTLTWTPVSGWAGEYNVWFYATDECGSADSQAVTVTVVTDSLPIVTLSSFVHGQSVRANDSVYVQGDTVIVSVSARDPEGGAMTIEVDSLPAGATFADNGLGLAVFTFFTEGLPKGSYFIEFNISDGCGLSTASITLVDSAMISTGVASTDNGELPDHFALGQNYPNPFNPTTIIEFDLSQRTYVTLDVYNVLGQHIRNLVDGVLSRQRYSVEWDGTSDAGVKVATGIYFYRMATQEYQETRKMVLIK